MHWDKNTEEFVQWAINPRTRLDTVRRELEAIENLSGRAEVWRVIRPLLEEQKAAHEEANRPPGTAEAKLEMLMKFRLESMISRTIPK